MPADPQPPDWLPALAGLRFAREVRWQARVASTNDEVRRLAAEGAPEGLLVVADVQTAGRGRAGRAWQTLPGSSLAFSLLLRPALPAGEAARLSMWAGVGASEGIEAACGLPARLKWPNDLLVGGRKVGGILLESALAGDEVDHAVLGIGINVTQAPPPEMVDFAASSLQAEAGAPVDRGQVLGAILERLEARWAGLATPESAREIFAAWRARLEWLGQPVTARTSSGDYAGTAEDVEADGSLRLRLDTGETLRVTAGDVRLRPRPRPLD